MKRISLYGLVVVFVFASSVQAQKLYKWVDENGVTHYQESRPDSNVEHVALQFPDKYDVSNPEEEYYSIQNQLKRLQESRAQQQAARQQQQANTQAREVQIQEVYVPTHEPYRRYYAPRHYSHYGKGHQYKQAKTPCCQNLKVERPPARILQKSQPRRSAGYVATKYK